MGLFLNGALQPEGEQLMHGFLNRTNTFTWTNTGPDRTLVINGVVQYYLQGKLKTITNPTVQLGTSTSGIWFIYFNSAGVLAADQLGMPDFETTVIVALVWWNATSSLGCVMDERHGYLRDRKWHNWAHSSIGCRYGSGITLTATGTGAAASLSVSLAGDIWDEDIQFTVPISSSWLVANSVRIFYLQPGGTYTFANSLNPFLWNGGTSRVRYPNSSHATPYTLADMNSSGYINIWAYACNDIHQPIHLIVETLAGTGGYTNASNARQAAPPSLLGMGLAPEMKLIKRIVVKGDGEVQAAISADDYRSASPLPSGGTSVISAAAVTFAPAGNIAATSVQGAVEELDTEKAPLASPTFTGYVVTSKQSFIEVSSGEPPTITTADFSKVFIHSHASDSKTWNLPSVAAGDMGGELTFIKTGTGVMTIDAADSDIIEDSSAGGTIYSGASIASITLQLVGAALWKIKEATGTWTTT